MKDSIEFILVALGIFGLLGFVASLGLWMK